MFKTYFLTFVVHDHSLQMSKNISLFVDFFKHFETVKTTTRRYDPYVTSNRAKEICDLQRLKYTLNSILCNVFSKTYSNIRKILLHAGKKKVSN